eukprot:gnl/MRDRNA2_/MRDRNA2_104421_c0_seq1.p1 gnl/MRDRNA2_/MRDRNA2_104421_c0~~gnl/MRDRNA2_/MRDRNA2_104421_c0_seq1.p1  ORF type:complete len:557 (+),score=71.15 gnl/MRDRNA2_/MRDRNA2_104421_c0_seq1:101-1672(+)
MASQNERMYGAAGARPRGSSNSFAQGSNQNSGNHITNTPTTRVVAPPGGASSFSLGWDGNTRNTRSASGYMSRDASLSRQSECVARDASTSRQRMSSKDIQAMPQDRPTPHQEYAQRPGRGMPPRMPRSASTCRQYESTYPRDTHDDVSSHAPRSSTAFGNRPRESSNTFAHGSNQNCGNFISDVPTTRVAAPPGGRSSLNLSWGDDCTNERNAEYTYQRGPSYQMNDAEMPHDSWAGSSVRASSNQRSMHDREMPHDSRTGSSVRTSSNPRGMHGYSHQHQCPAGEKSGCTPRDFNTFGQRPRESSNTYAHGSNQNCGNVISDVPTTRVVAPPGGRSSLNLAWGDDRANDRNAPGAAQVRQEFNTNMAHVSRGGSSVRNSSNSRMMYDQEEQTSVYGTETRRHTQRDSNTFGQQPPSMNICNGSHNAEPLDQVNHLKQMFKESRARMARMNQDDEDRSFGHCPASEASKLYGGAGISRTGSGSTSASGGRYNGYYSQSGMSDDVSDADELPLGAEWSSFYQR